MRREHNNDYFYHIYNRGGDKRNVFLDERDYLRFLESMKYFNCSLPAGSLRLRKEIEKRDPSGPTAEASAVGPLGSVPLVKILCYCLNRNHYHLLLKQLRRGGISKFMQKLATAYTMYANAKYKRSGSLFQGKYKYTEIKNTDALSYISAYINGNREIHGMGEAVDYKWSSYRDYLGLRNGTLCDKNPVMEQFKDINEYREYVDWVIRYAKEMKDDYKELTLE